MHKFGPVLLKWFGCCRPQMDFALHTGKRQLVKMFPAAV